MSDHSMILKYRRDGYKSYFSLKTLLFAAVATTVTMSCTRSQEEKITPNTKLTDSPKPDAKRMRNTAWYTNNPDADTFYIATADELAELAQLVNADTINIVTTTNLSSFLDKMAGFTDTSHIDTADATNAETDIGVGDTITFYQKTNKISFEGKTVILTDDIDLSPYGKGWIPIGHCGGDEDEECYGPFTFNGSFDGNGKKISGLYSKHEARGDHEGRLTYIPGGLFGSVSGTVKNLSVVGAEVEGGGGIVGMLSGGIVSNCSFTGTVTNKNGMAGGIVAWMSYGSVSNCGFTGTVSGKSATGGIVGNVGLWGHGGSISNCYSTGTVSGGAGAGGIAGALDGKNSSVSNCYSTAAVSGTSSVGGIVGFVNNLTKTKEYIDLRQRNMDNNYYDNKDLSETYYRQVKTITLFDTLNVSVSNNAALNPSVRAAGSSSHIPLITLPDWEVDGLGFEEYRAPDSSFKRGGRVVGGSDGGRLSGNAAFSGIVNKNGNTKWNDRTATSINGKNIAASLIKSDGTLGGRFTNENGWTTENGKLPGLSGKTVELPEHLR